ncbi:MAG: mannose-6-phosphate isomerase [Candidatus Diapherotrites archaeon]|nr:mannose-6-phosphate isomerase [Candidatus Diapherotrites archaeon]
MNSIKKPWGKFETFAFNEKCTVKIIEVKKNGILSLQKHKFRNELWVPLDKGLIIQIREKKIKGIVGKKYFIPKKTVHRLSAVKKARILEISFGKFDEKDIERIEDKYGRVKK